jgi:hypothetical protein
LGTHDRSKRSMSSKGAHNPDHVEEDPPRTLSREVVLIAIPRESRSRRPSENVVGVACPLSRMQIAIRGLRRASCLATVMPAGPVPIMQTSYVRPGTSRCSPSYGMVAYGASRNSMASRTQHLGSMSTPADVCYRRDVPTRLEHVTLLGPLR